LTDSPAKLFANFFSKAEARFRKSCEKSLNKITAKVASKKVLV